jgi:WD40 repeat protein
MKVTLKRLHELVSAGDGVRDASLRAATDAPLVMDVSFGKKPSTIWDANKGRRVASVVEGGALSRDGTLAAAASKKQLLVVPLDGGRKRTFKLEGLADGTPTFSLDSEWVGIRDMSVGYRLFRTRAARGDATFEDESARTWDFVAILPDQVLSASRDNQLVLWDIATGKSKPLPKKPGSVDFLFISTDGSRVVTVGAKGHVTLWDLPERRCLAQHSFKSDIAHATATPDLSRIALDLDGVSVIDTTSGRVVQKKWQGRKHSWVASSLGEGLAFVHPRTNGSHLLVSLLREDDNIQLNDVDTGKRLGALSLESDPIACTAMGDLIAVKEAAGTLSVLRASVASR